MANTTATPLISVDQLRHAVDELEKKTSSSETIYEEYAVLEGKQMTVEEKNKKCCIAISEDLDVDTSNRKNRYPNDVLPYDDNRVILEQHEDYKPSPQGYINASFLTAGTPENVTRFIATQGPRPNTSEDFWEMILQYRCPYIVMLTGLVNSENAEKCGDYFQLEDGPSEFGDISIAIKDQKTIADSLVLRSIDVKNKKSEEPPFSVQHILYLGWLDHGIPDNTDLVLEIYHRVSASLGPVVVHCSAGIGRTGSYILIHNTIQRLLLGDDTALDLAGTITTLRSQRYGMVERKSQYKFSYEAIIAGLKRFIRNNETSSNI